MSVFVRGVNGASLLYSRAGVNGQAFPTRERHRVFDYKAIGNWTVLQIASGDQGKL